MILSYGIGWDHGIMGSRLEGYCQGEVVGVPILPLPAIWCYPISRIPKTVYCILFYSNIWNTQLYIENTHKQKIDANIFNDDRYPMPYLPYPKNGILYSILQ